MLKLSLKFKERNSSKKEHVKIPDPSKEGVF